MGRRLETSLPTSYRCCDGDTIDVYGEEDAIVWLWANPELLPWARTVEWLRSPVTGKDRWPGDLRGVDESGELVIIENKKDFKDNPFVDFVGYYRPGRQEWSADSLRRHWERDYKHEVRFPNTFVVRGDLTAGLLARSSKRVPIRRWPELARMADARIREESYRQRVETFLDKRATRNNPEPHHCGLIVQVTPEAKSLPSGARASMEDLATLSGANHVHLYVCCARILAHGGAGRVEIAFRRSPY